MKINSTLKAMAAYNPTKQTFQMSALNLCEKIESTDITLPLYQRDVSWTTKKSVELLNYQLNGKAPVSPISINKITNIEYKFVPQLTLIEREPLQSIKPGQLSITDGQQRLTTNFKAYINHSDFRNIVLDLVRGLFVLLDSEASIKNYQIPVGVLLNKDNEIFFDYITKNAVLKKPESTSVLLQVRSKLRDYNYTINLAEDLTEEEQIEWFEVLNNAGSRVTRIQMRFSKLKLEGIDIYSHYTKIYKEKLDEAGFDLFDMKNTEVSIPIANLNCAYEIVTEKEHSFNFAPIPSDVKENQLCTLNGKQLNRCFDITLTALDNAICFISNNKLKQPNRIDLITYLTGFFVYLQKNELSNEENEYLIKWYNGVRFENTSNGKRRKIFEDLINQR